MVNRAPRTAAATRHCTPVLGVGHVLLSSPPTPRVQLHSGSQHLVRSQPGAINSDKPPRRVALLHAPCTWKALLSRHLLDILVSFVTRTTALIWMLLRASRLTKDLVSICYTPLRSWRRGPHPLDLSSCLVHNWQQQSAFNRQQCEFIDVARFDALSASNCAILVYQWDQKLSRDISTFVDSWFLEVPSSARQTEERESSDLRKPCRESTVSRATSSRIVLSAGGWIRPDHGHSRHGMSVLSL